MSMYGGDGNAHLMLLKMKGCKEVIAWQYAKEIARQISMLTVEKGRKKVAGTYMPS